MYQPGDDVRAIDWRVTARTGEVHTKLFHEERDRPVHLLVDMRSMMRFGSRVRFKSHLAAEIAAMLAWVGHDGGDTVGGMVMAADGLHDVGRSRTRRGLMAFLERLVESSAPAGPDTAPVSLADGLARMRRVCRPGTLAFVISDFADADVAVETELRRLGGHAHVTLIFVSDPLDAHLPARGGRLSDGEAVVDLSALRGDRFSEYAATHEARRKGIEALARRRGMAFVEIATPDDPRRLLRPDLGVSAGRRRAA